MYITVWFPNNTNILDCVVHITIQSKLKMSKNRFKIEGEYDRCLAEEEYQISIFILIT